MQRKHKRNRLTSFMMAFAMVLSLFSTIYVAGPEAMAASGDMIEITLPNGDFESGTSGWKFSGFPSNEVKEDSSDTGNSTNTFNVWASNDNDTEVSMSYTVQLTEGDYYFTFELSGKEDSSSGLSYNVTVDGSSKASGTEISTTGYGNWQTIQTDNFTLEEEAEVIFILSGTLPQSYWGHLDNLKLYGTGAIAEEDDEDTLPEISLPNGDFENGDYENWTLTGYTQGVEQSTDSVNGTYYLNLYTADETLASASYTVKLTAGDYYFTFELSGDSTTSDKTGESGLSYSVDATDGSNLAKGEDKYVTNGWGTWDKYKTTTFTLNEETEVTFTLSGTQPAGYWGCLDNLKLYGTGEIVVDMEEITLPNGDFENGTEGWSLKGWYETATSSNNTTSLSFWVDASNEVEVSASYTVILTQGTYYFSFDLSGAAVDSKLSYSVTADDKELAKGNETYTTIDWNTFTTYKTDTFTLDDETEVTFTLSGTQPADYWGNLDNLKLYGTGAIVVNAPDPVEAEIYVPYVAGTTDDDGFIRGMDVSSVLSLYNSWEHADGSVKFKDFDGEELEIQDFFQLLADSGTNYIRIRVWNDPYDASNHGYGGGNNDINAAITMGQYATEAGMKVLIDFHYSDFWADPGKQTAPKEWANYDITTKKDAVYNFTKESLEQLKAANVDVGMVQIGNETTGSICGENTWTNMAQIFSAGSQAVREVYEDEDEDVLVAIHFTNPEKTSTIKGLADNLNNYGVDYDVFATSWYPYWHGTTSNLTSVLSYVATTYNKKTMVAETSWAYTLDDGDGWDNTVRVGNNDTDNNYEFSPQGQALLIADAIKAVKNVGENGLGVFYWEPAWLPVQLYDGTNLSENQALWEQYGSGWASSYASDYDPDDAGKWYGGSAVDNQALFDFEGNPWPSLKTYLYVQTGTTGYDVTISSVESVTLEYTVGDTLGALPTELEVKDSLGKSTTFPVEWDADDIAAVDMDTPGTYTIHGTVTVDEQEVDAICTVIVKHENLLSNPGFEESSTTMYVVEGTYDGKGRTSAEDVHAGTYSYHFYSSSTLDFKISQTVTLDKGHYEFSLYTQGKAADDGDSTYAYVKIGDTVIQEPYTYAGWVEWQNPTITFDVEEDDTEVTVGANITTTEGGAWGTLDDWYLSEGNNPEHRGGEATCSQKAVCDLCGKEYGELDTDKHAYGKPEFTWAADGTSATATFTCANDTSHVEKVKADVTEKVTKQATYTEKGTKTCTATVTFEGTKYTNTKTVSIPVITCDAPEITSLSNVSTGVKITWGKVTGAAKYRVFYKTGSGSWKRVVDTTSTSYTWKGATSGTKYTFTVRCITSDGESYTSSYDTTGKSITYIAAPKLSSVSNASTGVKITWGKVTGASKYRVFYKTGSSGWKKIADTTSTSYIWTGAKSGTKYTFTVRCLSSDGKSYISSFDATGKSITYIAAPKLSSVSNVSTGVKITWGKVTGAAKYRVFYKTGSGSWKRIADTTSTSYVWKGAKSGTKYTFTVRCLSSDGKSYISSFDGTGKSITYIAAPKLSSVNKVSSGVKITWGKVTGASKYRVFYKTGSGSWKRIADTTSTNYTWTGAKSGTKYTFTVRCLSSDGKSYISSFDATGKTITYVK